MLKTELFLDSHINSAAFFNAASLVENKPEKTDGQNHLVFCSPYRCGPSVEKLLHLEITKDRLQRCLLEGATSLECHATSTLVFENKPCLWKGVTKHTLSVLETDRISASQYYTAMGSNKKESASNQTSTTYLQYGVERTSQYGVLYLHVLYLVNELVFCLSL